jgi:DNA-binding LytR/AlgR family response regulator
MGYIQMIKVAICDDEQSTVIEIKEMLSRCCIENGIKISIDSFYDGESLEDNIKKGQKYDLLYMDIQMKGQDGIIIAKNIQMMDKKVLIIYVSGYDKYIEEIFKVDTIGFILKPIKEEKFRERFFHAYERICDNREYFEYSYKNVMNKVLIGEILYFESMGRLIYIHKMNEENEFFYGKINDIEKMMAQRKNAFIRIHQSYLVNFHAISSRTKTEIKLITGEVLSISKEKQKQFVTEYCRLLGGEVRG